MGCAPLTSYLSGPNKIFYICCIANSVHRNSILRNSGGILRNFSILPDLNYEIPLNSVKYGIPPELFFVGLMDTLIENIIFVSCKQNHFKKSWMIYVSEGGRARRPWAPYFWPPDPIICKTDLRTPHQRLRTPHSCSEPHTTGPEPHITVSSFITQPIAALID